ncbi:MAG: pyridoxal-phosphate dependent enzyme [Vicingaceae bacterium]
MNLLQLPSPIEELKNPTFQQKGVRVFMKRDDLVHPEISGNKWRKLKFNILAAKAEGKTSILTFGGAFSNHIAATAVACRLAGMESIGVIRGDEFKSLNPTLKLAKEAGMHLHFVPRNEYKRRNELAYRNRLLDQYPNAYLVPEGGANQNGVRGCEEIMSETDHSFDYLLTAAGTGTTAAGLLKSMQKGRLVVFSALKGAASLEEDIVEMAGYSYSGALTMQNDFHFGGYAKLKPGLVNFVNQFYLDFKIPLDLVYTGKMVYGFWQLLEADFFPLGSQVLLLHTGGLQGNKGMQERYGVQLSFG